MPRTTDAQSDSGPVNSGGQRIDKWLWFTRAVKTRSLAAKLVSSGKVRLNSDRISKPSQAVTVGDVLTFTLNRRVRVLKVVLTGTRRGPYEEARQLYEDLSPEPAMPNAPCAPDAAPAARPHGAGRPTKKQRRDINSWLSDGD